MKKLFIFTAVLFMLFNVGCSSSSDLTQTDEDFCYHQLSSKEKKAYNSINVGLQNMQTEINNDLGSLSEDDFDRVFKGVVADHPEYFWVSGSYTCYSGALIGEGKVSAVEPEYTISETEFKSKKSEFDNAVNSLVARYSSYSDDYSKAVALHDWLVASAVYTDDGNKLNSTAYGAIVNNKAICSGYAKAYKYLMNAVGVKCEYVEGTLSDGVGHAWNFVTVGSENFWVDTTLDDPVFLGINNSGVNIFYNFFGLTDSQIQSTHNLSDMYDTPECDSTEFYYYKRSGLYVEGSDISAVDSIIKRAYSGGKAVAVIKFSDITALNNAKSSLFDGNRIFDIIGNLTRVNYSVDSNNCLLMIKLR